MVEWKEIPEKMNEAEKINRILEALGEYPGEPSWDEWGDPDSMSCTFCLEWWDDLRKVFTPGQIGLGRTRVLESHQKDCAVQLARQILRDRENYAQQDAAYQEFARQAKELEERILQALRWGNKIAAASLTDQLNELLENNK